MIRPFVNVVRVSADCLGNRRRRGAARLRRALVCGLVAACQTAAATPPAPPVPLSPEAAPANLQVLHWWTSASERKAADLLAARLAEERIQWQDAAIPGGAGIGAGKVLKGRVLAGDAPEVTQMIGPSIAEWADLGLLLELDNVAAAGNWNRFLFPSIEALIVHRKHVMAVPLGIHRVNTLYYNRALFARLKLAPPQNWAEFEAVANRLRQAGILPLAQSSEAWQVAALFENLVLAESGPAFYRELFVQLSSAAAADHRTGEALRRLRTAKGWLHGRLEERSWPEVVAAFAQGRAGMMIMGDWAKSELAEHGAALDRDYGCAAAPGTAAYHLYSVDTLAMFAGDYRRMPAQERMARLLVTPALQADFNALKGGVPVRRDADPARMDSCARASWTTFAKGVAVQAPSLVHRMATEEPSRDAIIAEVHRFFMDDRVPVAEAQRRLGALFRLFNLKNQGAPGAQDTDRRR
ncbi:ABC transporter substrate-binding protein [Herbaspirillum sp. SJZ107]|uniref:ABC transporter substrate-binding protein n=1 Tax=Herbaspirillum sp. SJZ107 TaxID=2572881 RepID=UPI001170914D|nr:ABC transporter substrate-binding protein [Herbaspirillum sp. SJZ107]TQK08312.1 glucose/mannose transport system substrate-binding protein [Herbaspirillum sp. SJZ107]